MKRRAPLIAIAWLLPALVLTRLEATAVSLARTQAVDEKIDFIRFDGAVYL